MTRLFLTISMLLAAALPGHAQVVASKQVDGGGSGPFKAIAATEATLPDFVVYRPADLAAAHAAAGALPVMVWGNGGCHDTSLNHERVLTEIASHGYVVIAIGALELTPRRERVSTPSSRLVDAMDWIQTRAATAGTDYHGRVETGKMAAGGQSCGGAQVLYASADPRVATSLMFNSGIGNMTMAGADRESLKALHAPIVYIVGGPSDVAFANAELDYERIGSAPVAFTSLDDGGHMGTFGEEFGGSYSRMALDWLEWRMKGRTERAGVFLAGDVASYPGWTVRARDPRPRALPRSTPEAEGVSSAGIESFLDAVGKSGLEVHSFMLLRHGRVVAEGWWKPYGPELRHIMFSASKSVTALGVGIAADEGRLRLDDRVISFFPEHDTDSVGTAMRALTVRHLLTMSVGQAEDPSGAARASSDWVRTFLHAPPVHKPGSVFMYNNMATFMLSAIVQKATGERLFDYLQPRLFQPLGIENVTWDLNPQGITVGMIGARLHTEDLAKLGQLMLQKGRWKGKQLVSAAFVEDAAKFHIGTDNGVAGERTDGQRGYGYQLWLGSHNSYRMDGMGGQLSIVLPDHDAVVVLTSNVRNVLDELPLVWQHLVPAMRGEALAADPAAHARLLAKLAALRIEPAAGAPTGPLARQLAGGRRFVLDENPQGLRAVTFALRDDRCVVTLERADEVRTLEAGLGAWRYARLGTTSLAGAAPAGGFRRSSNGTRPDTAGAAALSCGVSDAGRLELTARFVEDSLGAESWVAEFAPDGAGVSITTGAGRPGGPPPVLRGTLQSM